MESQTTTALRSWNELLSIQDINFNIESIYSPWHFFMEHTYVVIFSIDDVPKESALIVLIRSLNSRDDLVRIKVLNIQSDNTSLENMTTMCLLFKYQSQNQLWRK